MTVDRRSYAWWVTLTGELEDQPPHFNGRRSRRFMHRTRAQALEQFAMLSDASHQERLEALYPLGGTTRAVIRWVIVWGAAKEHGRICKPGREDQMTRDQKIQSLIESGLADDRQDDIEQLVDMGEIDDDEPSEAGLERIAERVGIPFWMQV